MRRQNVLIYLVGEVRLVHVSEAHINRMCSQGWTVDMMVAIGGGMLAVTFSTLDTKLEVVPVPSEQRPTPAGKRLGSGGHFDGNGDY